jgi:ribonuclease Y
VDSLQVVWLLGTVVLLAVAVSLASSAVSLRRRLTGLQSAHALEAEQASSRAETTLRAAEEQAVRLRADVARHRAETEAELARHRVEVERLRDEIERRELRLAEREDRLDSDNRRLQEQLSELARREEELDQRASALNDLGTIRRDELARVAGLSVDAAKAELTAALEHEAKLAAALRVREIEREAQEDGQSRAREVVTTAIQRIAAQQTAESVVSTLALPNDEMKGRIIGREGRNVRSFEQVTGVNVIIDDTPEAVLLSCFDPVRRETARVTLQALVADGRIHPSRIEEVHERSVAEVQRLCLRAGEDAVTEIGITDLHPELVRTLGQLRYRTSYGQNVLAHLLESAHLASLMADELGLDRTLVARGALLHDIGKALTHEAEGSHAMVGAELARRYGESDDVVHAIEAHHNEVEPRTVEAVLTQAADAISGSRPGARREALESYVQRLSALEAIASAKHGVEKVFAMQAGRELRVMVQPHEIDDLAAQVLARDIAKQVEQELTYPGQIRVTVVRESRATEVAR